MIILNGNCNFAKIFTDKLDDTTKEQLEGMLNHPVFGEKKQIRIMPDCHAGKGSVIGFTMPVGNHVIPNTVGVDIGCGIYSWNLGKLNIDLTELDNIIHENIPAGFNNRTDPYSLYDIFAESNDFAFNIELTSICANMELNYLDIRRSIGSLGGGNHFIELGVDENDNKWLTVHTGSRNFGLKVANYHQKKAKQLMDDMFIEVEKGMEYLPLTLGGQDYLNDMRVAQKLAHYNRIVIGKIIMDKLSSTGSLVTPIDKVFSVHNYISDDNIIRKGAISAHAGERVVIPFNMRDGLIIAKGKGNYDWNNSAPHGAGRILSRTKANEELTMDKFKESMSGIFSTCISKDTLDESPMAYKPMEEILQHIKDTVEIEKTVKPIYNFKSQEKIKRRKKLEKE